MSGEMNAWGECHGPRSGEGGRGETMKQEDGEPHPLLPGSILSKGGVGNDFTAP